MKTFNADDIVVQANYEATQATRRADQVTWLASELKRSAESEDELFEENKTLHAAMNERPTSEQYANALERLASLEAEAEELRELNATQSQTISTLIDHQTDAAKTISKLMFTNEELDMLRMAVQAKLLDKISSAAQIKYAALATKIKGLLA